MQCFQAGTTSIRIILLELEPQRKRQYYPFKLKFALYMIARAEDVLFYIRSRIMNNPYECSFQGTGVVC
jgi:hypothetical protein